MWQPDSTWRRLRSGGGGSTVGVWAAESDGRRWIVKRLAVPEEPDLHRPRHAGYWRREAEVALHPELFTGPGLVVPEVRRVEEDDDGITIWSADVEGEPPPALFVAKALGRFAGRPVPEVGWSASSVLGGRLAMAESRGGWPTLQRTTLADVADVLWERRGRWLDLLAASTHGQVHGDATPGNFLGAAGDDVVAVDWQCWGSGPVGTDLGYYALSCREEFAVLLDAFLAGLREVGHRAADDEVATAARVTAVYTVLSRAEWALSHAARGEGALAGKFGHPSVAPHLRALQRQFSQIDALLG